MPKPSDSNTELTPEAAEVLKGIIEETQALRELDLADAQPAGVFAAV